MTAREPDLSPLPTRSAVDGRQDARRLSQRDMRDRAGYSQSFVSRVENGEAAPSSKEPTAWVKATGAEDMLEGFLL